jgi:ribosomal protein S24E
MLFEIKTFRKKFKAILREKKNEQIDWFSREYPSEEEVREAIKKLEKIDWSTVVVQVSKY